MITTIKLRDLIKYLVGLITLVVISICSTRFFSELSNQEKYHINENNFTELIKYNISLAKYLENEENKRNKESFTSRGGINRILNLELPNINKEEIKELNENNEEIQEHQEEELPERTTSTIKETYTNTYGTVRIKNLTDINLTQNMIKPDYNVKNKKDILIFHTHTCESYTPTKENNYKASGNFRTTNLDYSVVKIGKTLEEELKKMNFTVIRDQTKHDYPAYSGSYTRSLETVENILNKNKDIEIVFDLHRDAVGNKADYAPTVEINGEKVAQLMFVIGTNDGGGKHPNWQNNLKFAVKIQEKANQMYPGLFRSINLRTSTFNQKVTNAASIIEVGATGNTLEEAALSMKYLSKILKETLQ